MMTGICIYQANDAIEANLVKGLLVGEGIDTHLQGEHLAGAMGELPPTDIAVKVMIAKRHEKQGLVIINQYLKNRRASHDSATDWTCSQCGEVNHSQFEICWQCQKDANEQ